MTTDPPTDTNAPDGDAAQAERQGSRDTGRRSWSVRRRTAVVAGAILGAVLIIGAGSGIISTAAATSAREAAVTVTNTTVHELAVTEISNEAARKDLEAGIEAAKQSSAATVPIIAAAPAYLSGTGTAVLDQARTALDTAVTSSTTVHPELPEYPAASTPFETPPVTRILPKDATAEQARAMTKKLIAVIEEVDGDTEGKRAALDALTASSGVVDQALEDVATTALSTDAPAVRAAAPNIDLAALEQAVVALQAAIDTDTGLSPAIIAYTGAAKTVLDAQTAYNTQAAIDAANATGNDTYVDPSTGESKPNPNYNGGGSGGSGGSGGGGGSNPGSGGGGGGGGSEGGGGGAPAPTPPRVVYGSSSCSGAGGYAEVSYSNRGITIPGSGVASINGPYDSGSGWRVDWTCG